MRCMYVIVCIDEQRGMLFNKRRQSRDVRIIEDISFMTKEICIHPFSEKLFLDKSIQCRIDEQFLNEAKDGEYCFVENQKLSPYRNKIEKLIVYRWNRKYPSDFKLDILLEEWELVSQNEFAGKSHEKITKEVYERK